MTTKEQSLREKVTEVLEDLITFGFEENQVEGALKSDIVRNTLKTYTQEILALFKEEVDGLIPKEQEDSEKWMLGWNLCIDEIQARRKERGI